MDYKLDFNYTVPVGDLVVNQDGVRLVYRPLEDITAYEVALILRMTVFSNGRYLDYHGYIRDNNLQRHFFNDPTTTA